MDLIAHAGVGVVVGIFSAIFGVGGGLLMVPYLVLLHEHSQHVAEGTSLLVIIPTALAGAAAHARRGLVAIDVALWTGIGGVAGALVGSLTAHEIDPEGLQRAFGAFIILMGLRMIFGGVERSASTS